MKTKKDYVPKFSLSVKYLKEILTKKEFKDLMDRYVMYKKLNWGNYKGRNTTKK